MEKTLKMLCREQKLCALYINANDLESFMFGRIAAADDTFFLLKMYTPSGAFDGYCVFANSIIIKIEFDSRYCSSLARLIDHEEAPAPNIQAPVKKSALEFCRRERKLVSFELLDSGKKTFDLVGFIEAVDDDVIRLKQIHEYGGDDGIVIVNTSDITGLQFDSSVELRCQRLYDLNSKC